MWLSSPYLQGQVELTDERRSHIERRHPELLSAHSDRLVETVLDPGRDAGQPANQRRCRMATPLKFEYDEVGDILYIEKMPPPADQATVQLSYNIVARTNRQTHAVESVEVLFFTRGLLKNQQFANLQDLFSKPVAA